MKPARSFVAFMSGTAVLLLLAAPLAAQERAQAGTLRLVVQDQTGGVLPGAVVRVKGTESGNRHLALSDVAADAQGVAVVPDLPAGRYDVEVRFPGFEPGVMRAVRVRAGDNRRTVTLAIEKLDENVSVGRDTATAASDANSDRYSNVLSKEQIRRCRTTLTRWSGSSRTWRDQAGRYASMASTAASCRPSRRFDRFGFRAGCSQPRTTAAG